MPERVEPFFRAPLALLGALSGFSDEVVMAEVAVGTALKERPRQRSVRPGRPAAGVLVPLAGKNLRLLLRIGPLAGNKWMCGYGARQQPF